jgi:hypothetical protein
MYFVTYMIPVSRCHDCTSRPQLFFHNLFYSLHDHHAQLLPILCSFYSSSTVSRCKEYRAAMWVWYKCTDFCKSMPYTLNMQTGTSRMAVNFYQIVASYCRRQYSSKSLSWGPWILHIWRWSSGLVLVVLKFSSRWILCFCSLSEGHSIKNAYHLLPHRTCKCVCVFCGYVALVEALWSAIHLSSYRI